MGEDASQQDNIMGVPLAPHERELLPQITQAMDRIASDARIPRLVSPTIRRIGKELRGIGAFPYPIPPTHPSLVLKSLDVQVLGDGVTKEQLKKIIDGTYQSTQRSEDETPSEEEIALSEYHASHPLNMFPQQTIIFHRNNDPADPFYLTFTIMPPRTTIDLAQQTH